MHHNGFNPPSNPVLEPIESIRRMDAILADTTPLPSERTWPTAEFIVGNPPFLGSSRIWEEVGREYQQRLWDVYSDRVSGAADLCCYWFEKARWQIQKSLFQRAGLLATQGIRGGVNRESLDRIKESGDIFFAVSDQDWILDGAHVHVSMVGFDDGREKERILDGLIVNSINANLTSHADVTKAEKLPQNVAVSFRGTQKSGDFNVPEELALDWLSRPNPHREPNSMLLRPWINGTAIVQRVANQWIIDTGVGSNLETICLFEEPFRHILEHVKPARDRNKREFRREHWWLHAETAPGMRDALLGRHRFLATPRVSKHRIFVWFDSVILPDDGIYVFARDDDYFFGVVHSGVHEAWARSQGTQVRDRESGFRYTPTTCFETFPFPEPTDAQRTAIADAARELDQLRNNWLNPPEWTTTQTLEFPGTVGGPWDRYIDPATIHPLYPPAPSPSEGRAGEGGEAGTRRNPPSLTLPAEGREPELGVVKYPRTIPRDEAAARDLKNRTLTNLYNLRPAWLDLAHRRLDEAVFAAYGWSPDASDDDLLAKLLELNLARAANDQA